MMRNCDDCGNWAQWAVRTPVWGLDPADAQKKKQIIVGWQHIGFVCPEHKQKMMDLEQREIVLHFAFIGGMPIGAHHS